MAYRRGHDSPKRDKIMFQFLKFTVWNSVLGCVQWQAVVARAVHRSMEYSSIAFCCYRS